MRPVKKNKYKQLLLLPFAAVFAIAALGLASFQNPTNPSAQQQWISLFNGKNLDGWIPKFTGHELGVNYKNTFRVEDGLLKVSYDNYETFDGKFGHLYYEQPYSKYRIRLEYRFVGKQIPGAPDWAYRNSGIKFHCQPPETMALDQQSPVSIEVQLLGGDGENDRPTANICSMGTHIEIDGELITQHCTESSSETYHGSQWVEVEAEVNGGDIIKHYINGKEVLAYSNPQYDTEDDNTKNLIADPDNLLIEDGYIALQAESHPVHFRNIELLPLDEE